MQDISIIIISALAALGVMLLLQLGLNALFRAELRRAVLVVPVYSADAPVGELLCAVRFWNRCRVLAVDMSGQIAARGDYVAAGLCERFTDAGDAAAALEQLIAAKGVELGRKV